MLLQQTQQPFPLLPRTIYDFDFTTAPTDAGMADGATKSFAGLTWTFHKGTNLAGVIDSGGLNYNYTGVSNADAMFSFLMSDLGLDPISSRYRVSLYHNVLAAVVGQDVYLGFGPCASQTAASATNFFGLIVSNASGVLTTTSYKLLGGDIVSTNAALNGTTNVSIFENSGGVFTTRKGTYSGGFPAISSCPVQVSSPILPSLLNGATTGLATPWYFNLFGQNSAYVATPVSITFKRIKIELL